MKMVSPETKEVTFAKLSINSHPRPRPYEGISSGPLSLRSFLNAPDSGSGSEVRKMTVQELGAESPPLRIESRPEFIDHLDTHIIGGKGNEKPLNIEGWNVLSRISPKPIDIHVDEFEPSGRDLLSKSHRTEPQNFISRQASDSQPSIERQGSSSSEIADSISNRRAIRSTDSFIPYNHELASSAKLIEKIGNNGTRTICLIHFIFGNTYLINNR